MNSFQVTIGGQTVTNVSLPFKYGNFLDQQLDYATMTLTRVNVENFAPCTPVIVSVTSRNTANEVEYVQSKQFEYIVQSDNSRESPVGSGFYRHELTLIEPTKLLEIPLESLCFTNAGLKDYKKQPSPITKEILDNNDASDYVIPQVLYSPTGGSIQLPNLQEFLIPTSGATSFNGFTLTLINDPRITFTERNGQSTSFIYTNVDGSTNAVFNFPKPVTYYKVRVTFEYQFLNNNGVLSQPNMVDFSFDLVSIGDNYSVPQDYNVQGVITRILALQEPLCVIDRNTEDDEPGTIYPRFKFDLANIPEDKRALFTARNAPEFTFTRQTLREALQTIGGFIHAEPRLLYNSTTGEFDTITFDFFGEMDYAEYYDVNEKADKLLNEYNYEDKTFTWNIEQACNELDSYQENLVSRINRATEATAQPFLTGYQTLRAETVGARLEEENMYLPTSYPIHEVKGLSVIVGDTPYDITPYLYEETIYASQLSSYEDAYPTSKAYALYYKQNQKGVYGFFFKRENVTSGVFVNYAIKNILDLVVGYDVGSLNYQEMRFRIVYTPIHSARIKHSKQNIEEWLQYPRTLNYSQSANQVETKYFGENIKGAVERLGTLEKLVTFTCFNINTIPKPGLLWDEDYFISTVSVECMVDKFKVTCGLSKNFNQISQYIGVSSYKRQFEVSEVMVQTREWLWKDYIVLTDYTNTPPAAQDDCLIGASVMQYLKNTFLQDRASFFSKELAAVEVYGSDDTSSFTRVVLPLISVSVGNVMEFTWEYQDNYSAGQQVIKIDNDYYAQDVQYADYFGRMLYQNWKLATPSGMTDYLKPERLPQGAIESGIQIIQSKFMYMSKDSREKLKQTMAVEFVTDTKGFVIGSGLAEFNPMVRGLSAENWKPRLVTLPKRLNKFESYIRLDGVVEVFELTQNGDPLIYNSEFTVSDNYLAYYGDYNTATKSAKAWAYVVPVSLQSGTFYQVLFGKNINIVAGMKVGDFTAYALHDVYKYKKNRA